MIRDIWERRLSSAALYGSVAAVLLLFYIPIITLMVFSFRLGRYLVLPFDGLTLDWYRSLLGNADFQESAWNSFLIASAATAIATVCGTLLAIGLMRFRFRFRGALATLNLTPALFPQLLLGIVLLLWFVVLGNWLDFSLGFYTTVAGHVVYVTPFATIVVAVRLAALDHQLDDAARDCGASTWEVYRYVTLPLLWPGIFSAAIFCFLLSWSNFYLSFNLAGTTSMLPTFVYAGLAFNSSPAYPAIATIFFVPMVILVILAETLRRRQLRPSATESVTTEAYA